MGNVDTTEYSKNRRSGLVFVLVGYGRAEVVQDHRLLKKKWGLAMHSIDGIGERLSFTKKASTLLLKSTR